LRTHSKSNAADICRTRRRPVEEKGTPPEITKKLSDALLKALKDPGTRKRILDLGGDLSNEAAQTPDGLRKLVESEVARWSKALKGAGTAEAK